MKSRRIAIPEVRKVSLEEFEMDESLKPTEILVKTRYTLISPGTELAFYTNFDGWVERAFWGSGIQCYPHYPGYAGIGQVIAVGEGVNKIKKGDVVFSSFKHASMSKWDTRRFCSPVPNELDEKATILARLATIALTSVRVSSVEPGDSVAVFGLGIIGNFAAQLFREAGAFVIGIDPISARREIAAECDIDNTLDPRDPKFKEKLLESTQGLGPKMGVDAVGDSKLVLEIANLVRKMGEVILLGTPRASFQIDVTPFFRRVHLDWVTIKGALSIGVPEYDTVGVRHSLESNIRYLWALMSLKRLKVKSLITHVVKPEQFQEAYEGLLDKKEEYFGVLIDWT